MHLLNCICTLPLESLVRITLKALFGTVQLPLKKTPRKLVMDCYVTSS